jgi:hypothetical protein
MEIIYKDVKEPRLTIAKDRVTLKVPNDFTLGQVGEIKMKSEIVVSNFILIDKTYRGRFHNNQIIMWDDKKTTKKEFKF